MKRKKKKKENLKRKKENGKESDTSNRRIGGREIKRCVKGN